MARRVGGTVLEEPPPGTRRERRKQARPDRERRHGAPASDDPTSAPGPRQARRLQAERRRFWFVLVPSVAVLLALTVGVGAVIRANDGDDRGSAGPAGGAGSRRPDTLLFSHRGSDGRLDLLVLAGTNRDRAAILLLPTATLVEVPSFGTQALADLPTDGDTSLLQTTVENLLGVRVVKTRMLDDAALNAALAAAARIPAELHRAVQFDEASGELFAAGDHRLSAEDAARLLVTPQPGSELDRLVTVQDVLDGWLRRLQVRAVARETVGAEPDLATLVAAARAEDRRTDSLPVESVTTAGGERFEPDLRKVKRYIDAAFPNALLGGGTARPRVEILNGTGAVGLAQTIATRVVPAGGRVTLTGNVQRFGVANTQVVYYRDGDRAVAQQLLDALGCGALKKADRAIGVVDVTIIAGADCFRTGETSGP